MRERREIWLEQETTGSEPKMDTKGNIPQRIDGRGRRGLGDGRHLKSTSLGSEDGWAE